MAVAQWSCILRETGLETCQAFHRRQHVNEALARKLALETTLQGHEGCVNRLAWNEEGTLLASGSDDRKVILWPYPDAERVPILVSTEHRQNLFGVKFLPCTNNRRIITGAMDSLVQLHELDGAPQPALPSAASHSSSSGGSGGGGGGGARRANGARPGMRRHGALPQLQRVQPRTTVYSCHRSRVKDVEVEPGNPNLFWSAGEDGYLRQHDVRAPSHKAFESPNVLVAVPGPHGRLLELKGLDICAAAPHLLAVAGSDPTIRVYDRRKLSLGSPQGAQQGRGKPLLALAPPHLPLALKGRRLSRAHATCVSFSARGDRLVATYHGDHAYAFDVMGSGAAGAAFVAPAVPRGAANGWRQQRPSGAYSARPSAPTAAGPPSPDLPEAAERAKLEGNAALFEDRLSAAVDAFTRAIAAAPWAPGLYAQRANALLKRGWEGDGAFALRDADAAIALDGLHAQGHYRRAQAFRALGQYRCALAACDEYAHRFPDRDTDELSRMRQGIVAEMEDAKRRSEGLRQQRLRRRRLRVAVQPMEVTTETELRVPTDDDSDPSSGPAAAYMRRASEEAHADGSSDDGSDDGSDGDDGVDVDVWGGSSASDASDDEPLLELYGGALGLECYSHDGSSTSSASTSLGGSRGMASTDQARVTPHNGASTSGAGEVSAAGKGRASSAGAGNGGGADAGSSGRRKRRRHYRHARPGTGLWDATAGGRRLLARFAGHCNIQTDIKEAVFLGQGDALVACGSDDGRVFIYDADSGTPLRVLEADEDVANCVQCHPSEVVLATSGIEHGIKLWSPTGMPDDRPIDGIIANNQQRMRSGTGPLLRTVHPAAIQAALEDNPELLELLQRAYGIGMRAEGEEDDEGDDEGVGGGGPGEVTCRVH